MECTECSREKNKIQPSLAFNRMFLFESPSLTEIICKVLTAHLPSCSSFSLDTFVTLSWCFFLSIENEIPILRENFMGATL